MKNTTPSVVCAACTKLLTTTEAQVKMGRYIYCAACAGRKS
jgi:formylmethanofuran dehydrogenase subunit E